MDEQLKKALEELTALKAKLDAGMVSKEYYDAETAKLKSSIESIEARMKELGDLIKLRSTAMEGDKEMAKFSLGRALCGIILNKWYLPEKKRFGTAEESFESGKLKEYQDAIGKANEITSTGGSGGYAIPPQAIQQWIEKLYAETVLAKAGARVLTGLQGSPVYIPKHTGSMTAYWIGEGDEITNSKITDAQLTLTPKECAALAIVQNKTLMLAASNPSLEQLLFDDMDMQLQLAIDLAGLRGAGSSNEPRGAANTALINTLALGADGDYFNFDKAIDMETELAVDNALRGKLAYITHPRVKQILRKTKVAQFNGDTGGQYVLSSLSNAALEAQLGYPLHTTTQIPDNLTKGSGTQLSEVYFGNWADLIIAQWGVIDIARSDSAGNTFEKNQSAIRFIQMVDIALRHPESICLCNDAKTR